MIMPFKNKSPRIHPSVFVAPGAHIIGDVEIGDGTSIWFNTTVRGDCHMVRIGLKTNIQDNSVVHVTQGTGPVSIGSNVTIGHGAVIHACVISDRCLIGMGSIILDGAVIPPNSFVAAGSLISPGKTFPPGYLIKGSPAVATRPLRPEELAGIDQSVEYYVAYAKNYFPQ